MRADSVVSPAFARSLVLDELFDLTLYKALRPAASPALRTMLEDLIPIETRHMEFWRGFFGLPAEGLDWGRRLKLGFLSGACRLFGDAAIRLVLEGIEVHGIRKYLQVWEAAKGTPLGEAVRKILEDEMEHEDAIVLAGESSRMGPEKVRSIFLGFNDGCVEILGAVSGFMVAFRDAGHVLMAAATVAAAGAVSMAAGAWVATGSEREVSAVESAKKRFLDPQSAAGPSTESPLRAALLVGSSYAMGALVPILPVLLGAKGPWPTIVTGGAAVVGVSGILAFLTGMGVRRRAALNLAVIAAAVGVSWGIGLLARRLWGISV